MTISLILQIVFWGSLLALCYTFAGYALGSWLLAKCRPRPWRTEAPGEDLSVSVVLVAHNESGRIRERLENLLACERVPGAFEVVVVSDGSTDGMVDQIREMERPEVTVIEKAERSGKSCCLNGGIRAASGDIVVFGDARQRFAGDAIVKLVECFGDAEVGAASGSLEIEPGAGGGVDAYWRLEKLLRHTEALRDSSVGCTGAIYAVRRELCDAIPDDTWLDDVVIPMQIAQGGHRVVFVPEAVAYDPQALGGKSETRRKRRTLAGNFQMLFRYPEWMNPFESRLWWRLVSHKYLRLAAPVFLVAALVSSALLRSHPVYGAAFWAQSACYALGFIGLLIPLRWPAPVAFPAGFLFLNWMVVRGFVYFIKNRGRGDW